VHTSNVVTQRYYVSNYIKSSLTTKLRKAQHRNHSFTASV